MKKRIGAPDGSLTRVGEVDFKTSLRTHEKYIFERDSLDENMYELQKNLIRFIIKRKVK